ncbi:hypothetical protein FEM41_20225 [Jejubacter calystegiae]|uniref:Uncharacterized protein n=1 Tax=Jejubacter calystegiae TaxID=2579935 RepID=A0A4P8YPU5_9ENTR|nr:hypothetical protein [Jejubacter calystegiae]QCT21814.1 hypothetical protein FEM41_20225 [Jejubacter calystegiae]
MANKELMSIITDINVVLGEHQITDTSDDVIAYLIRRDGYSSIDDAIASGEFSPVKYKYTVRIEREIVVDE